MLQARVFQPAKTATSSGRFRTRQWIVEFEPNARQEVDRLIGWVGSNDMERQLTLRFATKEQAIAYCEKNAVAYTLTEPHVRIVRPKAYADNFIRRS